ncbi:hypothetical protein SAMN04489712_104311 [Thermomonospora echinospora]|uniref:Uncharacterized protein n=1 Tax=Thermomonospora echinospora TaxID=1992 RepID=A0A1H5Z2M9_9ACTN|nr:hypothetical protein [Thermomonospora echinospora]SEG30512.1 hypothetical protein SAMN04489712_104311 [Thermomonospora echinospora]
MSWATSDEVSVLWAEHLGLAFPDDLKGVEIHGEPVALLDAYTAGCVTGYVGGRLSDHQRLVLDDCARALRDLLPRLRHGEGHGYVARLVRMADLILSDSPRVPGS